MQLFLSDFLNSLSVDAPLSSDSSFYIHTVSILSNPIFLWDVLDAQCWVQWNLVILSLVILKLHFQKSCLFHN